MADGGETEKAEKLKCGKMAEDELRMADSELGKGRAG